MALKTPHPPSALPPTGVVLVSLQGHLTAEVLKAVLQDAEQELRDQSGVGLVVDASRMTG